MEQDKIIIKLMPGNKGNYNQRSGLGELRIVAFRLSGTEAENCLKSSR